MGRKIQFCLSKNHYKKKIKRRFLVSLRLASIYRSLVVRIPLDLVKPVSLPVSLPLESYLSSSIEELAVLKRRIAESACLPKGWYMFAENLDLQERLTICQMQMTDSSYDPVTSYTISVSSTMECTVTYYGNITSLAKNITNTNDMISFINFLQITPVCKGNPDAEFIKICESKDNMLRNRSGLVVAKVDTKNPFRTVRHVNCEIHLLNTDSERCTPCKEYRKTLFALTSKKTKPHKAEQLSSHVNHRFLSSNQKSNLIKSLRQISYKDKKMISHLRQKISQLTAEKGIVVEQSLGTELQSIAESHDMDVADKYPEDSFQRIFWEEQRKAMTTSDTGMRWHPVMIKWCLYLRHFSSKAYELLRSSGIIKLPSQRTLRDYTHFVASKSGFSADLDEQLVKQCDSANLEPYQRNVCLIADEMHVKEDLVYNKFTGELIGFANLGNINEHLKKLEQEITNDSEEVLAKTLFFFMVRGLFIHLNFPYATFPCASVKGDQLVPLFMEAIFRIELCGLNVVAINLDGNSSNRRLFQIMADKSGQEHSSSLI